MAIFISKTRMTGKKQTTIIKARDSQFLIHFPSFSVYLFNVYTTTVDFLQQAVLDGVDPGPAQISQNYGQR